MKNALVNYSDHFWGVDIEVHFANGWEACTDLTVSELCAYKDAIEKTLRGNYKIDIQDNMISFFADDADWQSLNPILDEMETHGCWFDYPDWHEITSSAK